MLALDWTTGPYTYNKLIRKYPNLMDTIFRHADSVRLWEVAARYRLADTGIVEEEYYEHIFPACRIKHWVSRGYRPDISDAVFLCEEATRKLALQNIHLRDDLIDLYHEQLGTFPRVLGSEEDGKDYLVFQAPHEFASEMICLPVEATEDEYLEARAREVERVDSYATSPRRFDGPTIIY